MKASANQWETGPFNLDPDAARQEIKAIREEFSQAHRNPEQVSHDSWQDISRRLHQAHRACLMLEEHMDAFRIIQDLSLTKLELISREPGNTARGATV